MNLSLGQTQALDMIRRIAKNQGSTRIGVVRGYAGTGKTTLLRVLAEELGEIGVVTPTGKAALRVREAASVEARTIHRWMYAPMEDEKTGNVAFSRKPPEKIYRPRSGLMVVDEASMVDRELWEEFYDTCCSLGLNIVIIGDAFQLPPVAPGEAKPFSLLSPDFPFHESITLTEVMRQALESPIIRASMAIRNNMMDSALDGIGYVLPSKLYAESARTVTEGGMVICRTNELRQKLNGMVRSTMGLPGVLMRGEPLLVLKNDYSLNIYNGEIVKFMDWMIEPALKEVYDPFKKASFKLKFGKAQIWSESIEAEPENTIFTKKGNEKVIERERAGLVVEEVFGITDSLEGQDHNKTPVVGISQPGIAKAAKIHGLRVPHLHANFGYTFTCHKAQGSEWDDVIVVVQPHKMNLYNLDSRRWLYTAITRAKKNVRICYLNEG